MTNKQAIEEAKRLTSEYAKNHKGRNAIEKKCIRDGYLIATAYEVRGGYMDNTKKVIWGMAKNSSGNRINTIPVADYHEMIYEVKDRETNNGIFGRFSTLEEAENFVKEQEKEDKSNGNYTDDYYQIIEKEIVE